MQLCQLIIKIKNNYNYKKMCKFVVNVVIVFIYNNIINVCYTTTNQSKTVQIVTKNTDTLYSHSVHLISKKNIQLKKSL